MGDRGLSYLYRQVYKQGLQAVRKNPQGAEWMTSEERQTRARLAAHAMHSQYDSRLTTQRARKAFLDRFEREVDPDHLLSPVERARRASHARSAYFAALALKSAQVRRRGRPAHGGR